MLEKVTERQIVLGCIVSAEYLFQVKDIFDYNYFRSEAAKRICRWGFDFYNKYNKAIGEDITELYLEKLKKEHISEEVEEQIELILESISEEFERETFNFDYIADKTEEYFQARAVQLHQEKVQVLLDSGDTEEANKLIENFQMPIRKKGNGVDLSDPEILEKLQQAFQEKEKPLFKLPGSAGELVNEYLLRDSFIAFQGPEKAGKTWHLLEFAMRAAKQGCNVAFFQAGDMSENQQIRRISIYRAQLSDEEKYTGEQWITEKDCYYQQTDLCQEPQRECDFGLFPSNQSIQSRTDITAEMLQTAYEENPEYSPCRNCPKFLGTPFMRKVNLGSPLTVYDAQREFEKFFISKRRRFKLQTYANGTLSVPMINKQLDEWEKQGFIVDVVVIDYADILISSIVEFRHSQNDIWKSLRGLSQKRHCCVITATQADSASYKTDTMTMENFSEDKRKYAHVTMMMGLNKDKLGREKKIGMMRWNIIVAREGEFDPMKCVNIVQSLKQGRALMTSYW